MTEREYDVIVIGAGAVGENVADRAVQGGMSTAIVEAELVGPVTILAHAELLGQAERGRNQREAPRSAGRCTVGDSDGPRCNR